MNASPTLHTREHRDTRQGSSANLQNTTAADVGALAERRTKLRKVVMGVMGGALLLLCSAGISAAVRSTDETAVPVASTPPASANAAATQAVATKASPQSVAGATAPEPVTTRPTTAAAPAKAGAVRYVSAAMRSKPIYAPTKTKAKARTAKRLPATKQ